MVAAKVVIVEDNPVTLPSLIQTIDWQALNCEIAGYASDGESGRELILSVRPDLLLADIFMPQIDGLQMLEEVRQELPDMKVIIITGYERFQYASRAIKLSVFDYILKPIRNEELIQSVQRALQEARDAFSAQASQPALAPGADAVSVDQLLPRWAERASNAG